MKNILTWLRDCSCDALYVESFQIQCSRSQAVSGLLSGAVVFSLFNIFTKTLLLQMFVAKLSGYTKHNSVKNTE